MISIVVPVYNNHELTAECLAAVCRNTVGDFEIIVVDNGSTPPYSRIGPVRWLSDAKFLRNETNTGFPAAVNQGIAAAKGDIIVLLNNDVVVTDGWLDRLTSPLAGMIDSTTADSDKPTFILGNDGVAITSPVTNYCAGVQRVQAAIYEDQVGLESAAKEWGQAHRGDYQEVNFVIGFCMAFRKALWEKIGPFDESIWPSSGEEIDFCLRARAAGHKVAIVRDCYVHHYGSQTFTAMQSAGEVDYQKVCRKADQHLAAKWGAVFWTRQEVEA